MYRLIDFFFKCWHFILSIALFIILFPFFFSFFDPVIPFILLPILVTFVEFGMRKALNYKTKRGEMLSIVFL